MTIPCLATGRASGPAAVLRLGICLAVCLLGSRTFAQDQQLSPADATLLASLIPKPLIDPRGMTLVRVTCPVHTVWAMVQPCPRLGWAKPDTHGRVGVVTFTDGETFQVAQGAQVEIEDFIKICTDLIVESGSTDAADDQMVFARMRDTANGLPDLPLLAVAAWLHRLGKDPLAAIFLQHAKQEVPSSGDGKTQSVDLDLRHQLAWHAFAQLVHAYMVRADDEALAAGKRLLDLYPDLSDPQAATVVADIQRRRSLHHDDDGANPTLPPELATWPVDRQISVLIGALDEVDERQMSQPGGIDLAASPLVERLIAIGNPAVPALIDTLDSDTRLTRSVHFWRDFAQQRDVVSVREVALTAIMSIVRLPVFEADSTGEDFTSHGEAAAHQLAQKLRAYWATNGKLPLVQRLRATLLDANQPWPLRRQAAAQLGSLEDQTTLSTTVLSNRTDPAIDQHLRQSALALRGPTVAEAILQTMDQDLGRATRNRNDDPARARDLYLQALIGLGDPAACTALDAHGAKPAGLAAQCAWARVADALGDSRLMRQLSHDIITGPPSLGTDPSASSELLETVIGTLSQARDPSGHQALLAIQSSKHPYHGQVRDHLMSELYDPGSAWFSDPFCIGILASTLDDTTLTDNWCSLDGNAIALSGQRSGSEALPDGISHDECVATTQIRRCDAVATLLSQLLVGAPAYHPLLKDREFRRAQLRSFIGAYGSLLQPLTGAQAAALHLSPFSPHFTVLPALDHAATQEEVASHRAVFSLGAGASRSPLVLPAAATYLVPGKSDQDHAQRHETVLVIQAESDAGGHQHYGIASHEGLLAVDQQQLINIQAIDGQAHP